MLGVGILAAYCLGLVFLSFRDLGRLSSGRLKGNGQPAERVMPPQTAELRLWRRLCVAAFWLTTVAGGSGIILGSMAPDLLGLAALLTLPTLAFSVLFLVCSYRLIRFLGDDHATAIVSCLGAFFPVFAWLLYYGVGRRCAVAFDRGADHPIV